MENLNGGFKLIGLQLDKKTSNEAGQSSHDCGSLWQKFESEDYFKRVPGKLTDEIFAVYFDYEGDHTRPFSYFIGCQVEDSTEVPEGMSSLNIPRGNYTRLTTNGPMPDCVADAWEEIWKSRIERRYSYDFEVYGDKSRDWSNAEVEIYLSVR
ncbi:AraC family transcriptional regulator [Flavihumibacter sp. R14]|nr:AraC family transcriptional regulator [Flavihumibacter soli]